MASLTVDEKLAEAVRKYSILFDKLLKDFRDKDNKRNVAPSRGCNIHFVVYYFMKPTASFLAYIFSSSSSTMDNDDQ